MEKGERLRKRILRVIRSFGNVNGRPPSIRDLVDHLTIQSYGSMQYHLAVLKARGLIEWVGGAARTLTLTATGRAAIGIVCLDDFGPNPVVRIYVASVHPPQREGVLL